MVVACLATCLATKDSNCKLQCVINIYLNSISNTTTRLSVHSVLSASLKITHETHSITIVENIKVYHNVGLFVTLGVLIDICL